MLTAATVRYSTYDLNGTITIQLSFKFGTDVTTSVWCSAYSHIHRTTCQHHSLVLQKICRFNTFVYRGLKRFSPLGWGRLLGSVYSDENPEGVR